MKIRDLFSDKAVKTLCLVSGITASMAGWTIAKADSVKLTLPLPQSSSGQYQAAMAYDMPQLDELTPSVNSAEATDQTPMPDKPNRQLREGELVVLGLDAKGAILNRTVVTDPRFIRAEIFNPHTKEIEYSDALKHMVSELDVVVKADAQLVKVQILEPQFDVHGVHLNELAIYDVSTQTDTEAPFDAPIAQGDSQYYPKTTILNNGSAAQRVDLVLLGDGYTQADQNKWISDAQKIVDGFFKKEPFKRYKGAFNVHRIDVTSAESGVDHPEKGLYKNTTLNSKYACAGVQRLICADTAAVNGILNKTVNSNERDIVLVVVNDDEYGGSGGSIAVISTDTAAVDLALHEIGHSFGKLADEYDYQSERCSYSEPVERNVTSKYSRSQIKWASYINNSVQLPTYNALTEGAVGLFEGGRYCKSGIYRPTKDSMMRSLGKPFYKVNEQILVDRIKEFAPGFVPGTTTSTKPTTPTTTTSNNYQAIITESNKNLCLDIRGEQARAGAFVIVQTCQSKNSQAWAVFNDGTLRPKQSSSLCLDANPQQLARLNQCNNSASQRWQVSGKFIQNTGTSDAVLDVFYSYPYGNGAYVGIWPKHGYFNQQWSMSKQGVTTVNKKQCSGQYNKITQSRDELQACTPMTGLASTWSNWYWVRIPNNASITQLEITVRGGSGDANLFVNHSSKGWPNGYNSDFRSVNKGNNERIVIANPQRGSDYFIQIQAETPYKGLTLEVTM